MKPLSTAWTLPLQSDPEAKKNFETIVRNSTLLLTRLKEIIEEQERELLAASFSLSDFEDPNWSHKTAFRNGKLSNLREMKNLIPF